MAYDEKRRDAIFERTDGRCHICRKQLARKNYGTAGRRGAWEVDHSKPRAKGGSDRLNNLYPACISCNRSKQASATRTARSKKGYRAAPLSARKKARNGALGATLCTVAARALLPALGPGGLIGAGLLGFWAGAQYEPE